MAHSRAMRRPTPRLLAAWAASTLAAGCEGDPDLIATDVLRFEPSQLELVVQPVGEVAAARVSIVNRGSTSGRVRAVRFVPDRPEFQLVPADGSGSLLGLRLAPGRAVPVDVQFAPTTPGPHDVTVDVETDLVGARLQVTAQAARVDATQIDVDPREIDFGLVVLGEDAEATLVVSHQGTVPTRIATYDSDVTELEVMDFEAPESPLPSPSALLRPDDPVAIPVRFAPTGPGLVQGTLRLRWSGGAEVSIPVRADVQAPGQWSCPGEVDFGRVERGRVEARTVACSAAGGPVRLASAQLDDEDMQEFELGPVTQPTGSTVEIPVTYSAFGLAGEDHSTLTLSATHGAAVQVALVGQTVAPPAGAADLSASLAWSTSHIDLDLHLVRSGAEPFARGDDCYWGDKNPDWGDPDRRFDDPFLDRDATAGLGPEEVNLTDAEESQYDLYVQYHDYESSRGDVPTTATLQITLRDAPTQEFSRPLDRCGRLWHVARIVDGELQTVDVVDDRFRAFAAPKCR